MRMRSVTVTGNSAEPLPEVRVSGDMPTLLRRVYVQNDALMIDVESDDDDEFAKRVERKVAKGILNAVSVRYLMLPGHYRQNERGGFDCDAQELLEVSIVTIPVNARALRAKSLNGESDGIVERIAQRVVELLDVRRREAPRRRARQA
ncbi:phage prohead protease-like protein [Stigmatella aurantiaca DW4/3-1]|uniref:Phage prohead protease-like protein n=2 Tax=Stigmatella aurantiaca (strain DW4/3-1) TaxID=378806 RepID=E3FWS7_STIAD|nr:phage prohead protease-like protein [Stigmatella aurantiaca DW4/3-1]